MLAVCDQLIAGTYKPNQQVNLTDSTQRCASQISLLASFNRQCVPQPLLVPPECLPLLP
jgi:hypothetical protein